jgi:hypothetical protein
MQKRYKKALQGNFCLLCIDIEGPEEDVLEIAWAFYEPFTGALEAEVRYIQPKSMRKIREDAPFCHGIDARELSMRKLCSEQDVWLEIQTATRTRHKLLIISADENPESDIYTKVKLWNVPYQNVPLPKWVMRPTTHAHQDTVKLKNSGEINLADATCPFSKLHGIRNSGAHCALADVNELIEHVKNNQLAQLLLNSLYYLTTQKEKNAAAP